MLTKPVPGYVMSPYGWRVLNGVRNYHNGIDFGWLYADPEGSRRILSPATGTVVEAGWSDLVGYYITIRINATYRVRVMHMASIVVRAGQAVRAGQFLGIMGDKGTSTSQVHVHMDLWLNDGTRTDPAPFITNPYPGETAFAGGVETPIEPIEEEEDTMKLIKRAEGGPEWSLFHPSLRGPSELERGYIVITDPEIAKGLARTWGDGFGREKVEERDVYIGEQASARVTHDAYLRTIPSGQIAAVESAADLNPLVTRLDGIIATLTRIFK